MAQEGRLLAAALEARDRLEADDALRILVQLGQRHLARLRVVNAAGAVIADSALLGPRREPDESATDRAAEEAPDGTNLLYRIGSLPFRLLRQRAVDATSGADTDLSTDLLARPLGVIPGGRRGLSGSHRRL